MTSSSLKKFLVEDLNDFLNRIIIVKMIGGREVKGMLRSFDNQFNLILEGDDDSEYEDKFFCLGASIISISIE